MKILFDQGVPVPLRQELPGLEITTAYRLGWSNLSNGALLQAAEEAGLTVFVTTDKNLRYQQSLKERRIAIVVLPTTRWPEISPVSTGPLSLLGLLTQSAPSLLLAAFAIYYALMN